MMYFPPGARMTVVQYGRRSQCSPTECNDAPYTSRPDSAADVPGRVVMNGYDWAKWNSKSPLPRIPRSYPGSPANGTKGEREGRSCGWMVGEKYRWCCATHGCGCAAQKGESWEEKMLGATLGSHHEVDVLQANVGGKDRQSFVVRNNELTML